MKDLYKACRGLYEVAFPSEPPVFADALFARYFPKHLRVMGDNGRAVSMLFSIPYPIKTEEGFLNAHYLYAVATAPDYRGRGLATALIRQEIERGEPLFLRPSSPSLFDFYCKAGLMPFSPIVEKEGTAVAPVDGKHLTPAAYLALRQSMLPAPHASPTADFLSLAFLCGGAVELPGVCAALYEKQGELVLFKEWLGNVDFAPRLAAFLGGSRYRLRLPDAAGVPFAVGANLPVGTHFLLALD